MRFRSARHGRRLDTAIDITSLVDVVFLLLIFLLVTTTFKRQEHAFPIHLPTSTVKQVTVLTDRTTVFVDRQGSIRLLVVPQDGAGEGAVEAVSEPLSRDELRSRLQGLRMRRPDASVAIRAEKETSYQQMIDIVGVLEEVGIRNIFFPYDIEKP